MVGRRIADPAGVEGPAGADDGLGWLPVTTDFRAGKVLDRPRGRAVAGPGAGAPVGGYRIHQGRVSADGSAEPWLVADGRGEPLGWYRGHVVGTTLHGLFESDAFREAVLGWVAARAGRSWTPGGVDVARARLDRIDRIADALEEHLDVDAVFELITTADRPGLSASP
jgi:adenosylcobyric acid synthase